MQSPDISGCTESTFPLPVRNFCIITLNSVSEVVSVYHLGNDNTSATPQDQPPGSDGKRDDLRYYPTVGLAVVP